MSNLELSKLSLAGGSAVPEAPGASTGVPAGVSSVGVDVPSSDGQSSEEVENRDQDSGFGC